MTDTLTASIGNFAELVAEGTATPGGGSVAAYSGALAASLGQMSANLTIGKVQYASAEPRAKEIKTQLERLGEHLKHLISGDAVSFEAVLTAYRMPKGSEQEKEDRKRSIAIATRGAVDVPLQTARAAVEVLELLTELGKIANPNAFSDLAIGGRLAETAVKGAYYNIGVNLKTLADRDAAAAIEHQIGELIVTADRLTAEIEAGIERQM